jgi:transcriptional regulator with XRE-family HTH domain
MTIRDRFKTIRKDLSFNQEKFAMNLETNQPGIADIENGRKDVSISSMIILHKKFGVNLNWLIAGTGSSRYERPPLAPVTEQSPSIQENLKMVIDAQKETIEALKRAMLMLETRLKAYEEKNDKG